MRIYRIGICLAILLALQTAIESQNLVSRTPLALETFDEAWRIIHETHFDTNFNGHNWQEVREKFRPRAAAARNGDSFREVIQEMLDLLYKSSMDELDMLDYLVEWARIKYASEVFSPVKINLTEYINKVFELLNETASINTINLHHEI